jgi:hypothetical protein
MSVWLPPDLRSLRVDLARLDPIMFAEVAGPAARTALIFLIVRVGDPSAKSAIAQYPARPDVIVDDYFVARNDFRDQGEIDFAHLTLLLCLQENAGLRRTCISRPT